MERLILARHAESVFNVRGVLNGDPSIPGGLSATGREQSARLGGWLVDEPIDLCVTTEFERTRETADIEPSPGEAWLGSSFPSSTTHRTATSSSALTTSSVVGVS